jgi:hypothetical protein
MIFALINITVRQILFFENGLRRMNNSAAEQRGIRVPLLLYFEMNSRWQNDISGEVSEYHFYYISPQAAGNLTTEIK